MWDSLPQDRGQLAFQRRSHTHTPGNKIEPPPSEAVMGHPLVVGFQKDLGARGAVPKRAIATDRLTRLFIYRVQS